MTRGTKIYLAIAILLYGNILHAQQSENIIVPNKYASGFVMGLNVNLLIPIGVLANIYSAGFGGGITAKYIFNGKIGLGGVFNYQLLAPRSPGGFQNFTVVNYGGVLEYYLNKTGAFTPYFGLEVVSFDFVTNFGSGTGATGNSFSAKDTFYSGIGLCPNIGFAIQINKFVDSNINFKYNHILSNGGITSQIITISAGLIFHITKE